MKERQYMRVLAEYDCSLFTSVLGTRRDSLECVAGARLGNVVGIVDAAEESAARRRCEEESAICSADCECLPRARVLVHLWQDIARCAPNSSVCTPSCSSFVYTATAQLLTVNPASRSISLSLHRLPSRAFFPALHLRLHLAHPHTQLTFPSHTDCACLRQSWEHPYPEGLFPATSTDSCSLWMYKERACMSDPTCALARHEATTHGSSLRIEGIRIGTCLCKRTVEVNEPCQSRRTACTQLPSP